MVEVGNRSHCWRRSLGNASGVRGGWELTDVGGNGSKEEEAAGRWQCLEKSASLCPVIGKKPKQLR